jgi:hypothetical protein
LSETNPAQLTVVLIAGSFALLSVCSPFIHPIEQSDSFVIVQTTLIQLQKDATQSRTLFGSNAAGNDPNNQVVLLSYRPTVHNEDSTRNRHDSCQMNTNSWI